MVLRLSGLVDRHGARVCLPLAQLAFAGALLAFAASSGALPRSVALAGTVCRFKPTII